MDKAETTIKSIIHNNKNVRIYLLNYDIPQEWFINVNQYANQIGAEIIDEKFDPSILSSAQDPDFGHINKMTYARFLIPKMIPEDRVIYLDSDLIVDNSIDELFSIEFEGNKILASPHIYNDLGNGINPEGKQTSEINAGVLVINNKLLKKDKDLTDKLFKMSAENHAEADQDIINEYFKNYIGILSYKYNYQIGADFEAYWGNPVSDCVEELLASVNDPKIIHYVSPDKPFNFMSSGRMREKWWFYHNLEWSRIVQKYTIFDITKIGPQKFDGQVFIFTNSVAIQNLEELVKRLPKICFNIAAYTNFGWDLLKLIKYPNVKLYQTIIGEKQKRLIKTADAYLDINYGDKVYRIIDQVKGRNIPILSFGDTADQNNTYSNYTVFDNDQVDEMVDKINEIINNQNK
ncbi:glycosyltransferase family 8 protein [Lactobacillus crispatus]|uniref:glycosyltransferase family 8 protein n=1 Tax=Lactobacillus crispatus TaxID=47770 RepID=UPI0021B5BD04|nr:glycosyltransferase family 8 protein [Lactobacillus crispatus]